MQPELQMQIIYSIVKQVTSPGETLARILSLEGSQSAGGALGFRDLAID